ncbi:MAG: hypothetical protein ABJG78_18770 [Cyclobacteriaceae bacterium]
MEFEEMQKVWNKQSNEILYVINEDALHRRVKAKKKKANRIVDITEKGLMIVNTITAGILVADAIIDKEGFWDYGGALAMLFTVGYLLVIRRKRQKSENKFDRSMLGELDHAISSTQSTISIASTMIWWYFTPIAVFTISKMIFKGASVESWLLISGAFVLAYFLVNWEKSHCHEPRKRHLESLRQKLMD